MARQYTVSVPMLVYEAFTVTADSPEEAIKKTIRNEWDDDIGDVDFCETLEPDRAEWVCYLDGKEMARMPERKKA